MVAPQGTRATAAWSCSPWSLGVVVACEMLADAAADRLVVEICKRSVLARSERAVEIGARWQTSTSIGDVSGLSIRLV